jgi:hypothetical protein
MTSKSINEVKNKIETELDSKPEQLWQVYLFNCNCHSYDDVEEAFLEAINCSLYQAVHYALVAEEFGQVSFFSGSLAACKKVERPFIRIGLNTSIEPA